METKVTKITIGMSISNSRNIVMDKQADKGAMKEKWSGITPEVKMEIEISPDATQPEIEKLVVDKLREIQVMLVEESKAYFNIVVKSK